MAVAADLNNSTNIRVSILFYYVSLFVHGTRYSLPDGLDKQLINFNYSPLLRPIVCLSEIHAEVTEGCDPLNGLINEVIQGLQRLHRCWANRIPWKFIKSPVSSSCDCEK